MRCLTSIVALVLAATSVAQAAPASQPAGARFAPYADDSADLWNRLHRALFVRTARDGKQYVHSADPFLYSDSSFLLSGDSHRRALAALDEFLAAPPDAESHTPLKRLMLQRDLWAAFDYAALWADDAANHADRERAALPLRGRLATAIGRLALDDEQLKSLPDNYAQAVASHEFPADYDAAHPDRPFLPADLFDPGGPWVRFHDPIVPPPMARQHFDGAGGRAIHVIFLRLPQGRAATEQYLKSLNRDSIKQFPSGTMVAMVRRAIAIDRLADIRLTPITELVQIRVYRSVPQNPQFDPRHHTFSDYGQQDVCESILERVELFAGRHGLRAVGPDEHAEPFDRGDGFGDQFDHPLRPESNDPLLVQGMSVTALKSCTFCHQGPGVHSLLSMQRGLRLDPHEHGREIFRTYDWEVEASYTISSKSRQFKWGLLKGMLEAQRAAATTQP